MNYNGIKWGVGGTCICYHLLKHWSTIVSSKCSWLYILNRNLVILRLAPFIHLAQLVWDG
jgi:hypothetical protein